MAPYHQHLFSLRVDPAIDGNKNSLVYEESIAMPVNKATNPHGVGYISERTTIHQSGFADLDINKNRTFKIINPNVKNPINGEPVGYKLHALPSQVMTCLVDVEF